MPRIGASPRRFSDLEGVSLEWEEYPSFGESASSETGTFPHSMRTAGEKFEAILACPNPRCQDGGFEVGFLVESMISDRLNERIGLLVCIGWEREQGSKTARTPCTAAIRYRVRLSYRGPVGRVPRKDMNGKGEES